MCMEDIRIGNRIWSRVTRFVSSGTLPGDSNRVGLRLIGRFAANDTTRTAFVQTNDIAGVSHILFVNNPHPVDEVSIERHGAIVKYPLTIGSTGVATDILVWEFLLTNQQDAPGPPVFPGVGIRGPIPTATP